MSNFDEKYHVEMITYLSIHAMIIETFGFKLLCSQCLDFLFANFFRLWIQILSFSTSRFRSCYSPIQLDCQFIIRLNIFNKRLKFTFKQIIYSELKFLRFLSILRRAPTKNQVNQKFFRFLSKLLKQLRFVNHLQVNI